MNTESVAILTVLALSEAAAQLDLGNVIPIFTQSWMDGLNSDLSKLVLGGGGDVWDTSTEGRRGAWSRATGIPYCFDPAITADQRAVFKGAVDNLNSQLGGCIQWRTCLPTDKDYVLVIPGTGCWSQGIGYAGGRMYMGMEGWCFTQKICEHEMGHIMGLWHTQSRSDRDTNVLINWENMNPNCQSQYAKSNARVYGKYECKGNMHYGATACSINGQPVMVCKDSTVSPNEMGSASRLTTDEVSQIRQILGCSK